MILGAPLALTGGVLALGHPETLIEPNQHMNAAAGVYSGYVISRGLAPGSMLLLMLALGGRRTLATSMVLTAFIQVIDVVDASSGRVSLLPILLTFAIAFLLGASKLFGQPFWKVGAWRE